MNHLITVSRDVTDSSRLSLGGTAWCEMMKRLNPFSETSLSRQRHWSVLLGTQSVVVGHRGSPWTRLALIVAPSVGGER